MTKILLALMFMVITTFAQALPTAELLHEIEKHVVKVQVELSKGRTGEGSGVVVAKDQIVTNCHVISNARSINVLVNDESYAVSAIKTDWKHDVCIVKVEGLNISKVSVGSSENLKYEQAVFAVGYPNFEPTPVSTFGFVKNLYPMDDSVVLRTTSAFELGESGGGVFDDAGNLVGIIALRSPGKTPYYYNMAVEWVQALIEQPEQAINTKSELAFWAEAPEKWPDFMKVVHPYLTHDWNTLLAISKDWAEKEPNNTEAWFYLAAAEYASNNIQTAETYLNKVMAMSADHSQAIHYLGLIAQKKQDNLVAMSKITLPSNLKMSIVNQPTQKVAIAQNR